MGGPAVQADAFGSGNELKLVRLRADSFTGCSPKITSNLFSIILLHQKGGRGRGAAHFGADWRGRAGSFCGPSGVQSHLSIVRFGREMICKHLRCGRRSLFARSDSLRSLPSLEKKRRTRHPAQLGRLRSFQRPLSLVHCLHLGTLASQVEVSKLHCS